MGSVPLIAYSIAAALQSKHIQRVIVSTDDAEIAQVARDWGAEVPFIRPAELAQDATTDLPVFQHAIDWLAKEEGYTADIIVQLRPTTPFRPPNCVDEAIELLLANKQADSLRGVTPSGQNPFKMWRIQAEQLTPLVPTNFEEPYNMPRQKLPDTYWQTGHIEVIRRATIMDKNSMTGNPILPYIVDSVYAIDLDNLQQWQFAEYVLAHWKLSIVEPVGIMSS